MNRGKMKKETQRNQKNAEGRSVHPRTLARSVAKAMNRRTGQKENEIRGFREMIAKLPKTGKRTLRRKSA